MTLTDGMFQQMGWLLIWTFLFGLAGVPVVLVLRAIVRQAQRARSVVANGCFLLVAGAPIALAAGQHWRQAEPATRFADSIAESVAAPVSDDNAIDTVRRSAPIAPGRQRPSAETATPAGPSVLTGSYVIGSLPIIWLCGAVLTSGILFIGIAGTFRLRMRTSRLPDPLQSVVNRTFDKLGTSALPVKLCELVSTPILLGIVRPVILLPATAVGWSPETLEFVVLHEVAHARRFDNFVNLLQRVIEVLLFFQPAVWLASAWVREEREFCCDQFVTRSTHRPAEYARTLVALATDAPANTPVDLVSCSSTRHALVRRVERLLGREETMKIRTRTILCGAIACCLVSFASYRGLAAGEPQTQQSGTETKPKVDKREVEKREVNQAVPEKAGVADKTTQANQKPKAIDRLSIRWGRALLIDHVRLSATQSGVLRTVPEVGASVEKGALVAKLDNARQRLAHESLREQLAEPVDLRIAEKRLALAEKKLTSARRRPGIYSKQELDVLSGEVDLAKLEVSREHSKFAQLRSQLSLAAIALSDTELRTPISGRVTKVNRKVGEAVMSGEVVAEITSRKRMRVQFKVPLNIASRIGRGVEIEFTPRSMPSSKFRGAVKGVADEVEQINNEVWVHAIIDTPREAVRADELGSVEVLLPVTGKKRQPITSVTIKQRRTERILDGARLTIGDITAGQVLVTLKDREGQRLIDKKSMKLGDTTAFELAGASFNLRITQLTNVLIGTDFAVFDIEKLKNESR